ncbi:CaiB/BaiF CoA transferase family protein [Nakamurella leprariae]|uniref:CoA transferase n=1 Tax=Nakamurella leprariae TaxID=2803911 RepID=A0A939BXF5_9ACTN|nr:CoA transferase [Nakamurella leprariae]MBM9465925.1 CoA transferase [Nakamurella leprariae]
MNNGPLQGISVVEVGSGPAIALAARMMAGYGADVVKVEPPTGDPSRRVGPFPPGARDTETSAAFLYLHGGKRSVVIDLVRTDGRDRLRSLIDGADVVLVDVPDADRTRLGVDRSWWKAVAPDAVVVSMSPYGETGPRSGWLTSDLVAFATGGQMSLMGEPDREPLKSYGNQAELQAAFHVYGAALAGLRLRDRTGSGQYVRIDGQQVQASSMEAQGPMAYNRDPLPVAFTSRSGNGSRAIWSQYECVDGYVGVFVNAPNLPAFFAAIGRPELLERMTDAEFVGSELGPIVAQWCAERTMQQVFDAALEFGAPFSYVATPEVLLASDTVAATGIWRHVDHPVAGRFRVPGPPVRSAELAFELAPAPLLGEHTADVLRPTTTPAVTGRPVSDSE